MKNQNFKVFITLFFALLLISSGLFSQEGRGRGRVAGSVKDEKGNPLEGVAIRAEAPLGGLDTVSEDGKGQYHFNYTAPRGEQDTRVRIQVEAGSGKHVLRQHHVIALNGIAPPLPPAPRFSLGPAAAFMSNFSRLHSGGVNLDLGWQLPFLSGVLYLDLETGYRFGQNKLEISDGINLNTRLENVPLHLSLLYKPWPRHPVTAVIGFGGGAEFIQCRII